MPKVAKTYKLANLPTDKNEIFGFRYYVKVKNESFPEILRETFQLK